MRYILILITAFVIGILAACSGIGTYGGPSSQTSSPSSSASISAPPTGDPWSANDPWSLPNPQLSHGSTQGGGTYSQVCPHVDPALEAARPDTSEKAKIYEAYGLTYPQPTGEFELDHIVPIELGGAPDNTANLYPERNGTPDPTMESKWHLSSAFVHNAKDIEEDALHDLVCSGRVPLVTAQQVFETDWVKGYHTYVEGMSP